MIVIFEYEEIRAITALLQHSLDPDYPAEEGAISPGVKEFASQLITDYWSDPTALECHHNTLLEDTHISLMLDILGQRYDLGILLCKGIREVRVLDEYGAIAIFL